MIKREFISNVMNEVTVGGELPINLKIQRIEKIIEKSLKKFLENDNRMTIDDVILIDTSSLTCNKIKLSKDIKAVTRLEHTNGSTNGIFDGGEYAGSTFNSTTGSFGSGDLMSKISSEAYRSLLRAMGSRFLPYDFNEYENEIILKAKPLRNIFIEVARKISDEAVYEIDDFETYVKSMIIIDFVRSRSFIKTKLVGNREINFQELKSYADKDVEKIEKRWSDEASDSVMLLD